MREWWVPMVLLPFFWWLATSAMRDKSITIDEMGHITAGYSYLKSGDFRLDPQNGVLPKSWSALPLMSFRFPSTAKPAWQGADVDSLGYQFFFGSQNDVAEILRRSRGMIAFLGAVLGLIIYAWSKSIFGPAGAAISLALYVLCPTALTVAGLVTSDMAAPLFFTAATWFLWLSLHRVSVVSILASSASLAGLCLSKMSAGLILPIAIILIAVRLLCRKPLTVRLRGIRLVSLIRKQIQILVCALAVQALIAWVLIWGMYQFHYSAAADSREELYSGAWNYILRDTGFVGSTIGILRDCRALPEAFLFGTAYVWKHSHSTPDVPRPAFLNGEYSLEGFTSYFPSCVLFKTPLGTFAILILAGAAAVAVWINRKHKAKSPVAAFTKDAFYEMTPLAVLFFVYWAAAIHTALNIGNRHIFPVYPPMFVFAGAASYWIKSRHRVAQILLSCALLGVATESFAIRPHYLAYFNVFAGGPKNGHKHLVDGSIELGENLIFLRQWLEKNNPTQAPVYLSYFGHASTHYYGVYGNRLPTVNGLEPLEPFQGRLTGGIYCICATNLESIAPPVMGRWAVPYENAYQQLRAEIKPPGETSSLATPEQQQMEAQKRRLFQILRFNRLCAFLRHREPDDHVAYSMLIYRLTDDDLRRALDDPPAELLPAIDVKGYR